jgi:hypothetical protein
MSYEGTLAVDKTIKIITEFWNAGRTEVPAKFIGEVYKDGALVDHIESEQLSVPQWEKRSLISYFKIKEVGKYTVEGYVLFKDKKTDVASLEFEVGFITLELVAAIGAGVAILVTSVYIFRMKRKKARVNGNKHAMKAIKIKARRHIRNNR